MKKILIPCIAFTSLLMVSCGKDSPDANLCGITDLRSHPNSDSARLYIPNAFTPNGDGTNDVLRPVMAHISSFNFTVYDTQNHVVFQASQPAQAWSGPISVRPEEFRYVIEATTDGGDKLSWCGTVYSLPCIPDELNMDNLIFGDQFDPAGPEGYLHFSGENYNPCQ